MERADTVDRYEAPLRGLSDPLLSSPRRRRLLLGEWLGHAVHPLLTDVPIGAWTSAVLLDLSGRRGARESARFLIGAGLATAVPTAVTGVAEWRRFDAEQQRVGLVHAAANVTALNCFAVSFVARGRGRHRLGVA